MASHWVKCISTEGNLRGVAIDATDLIQAMADAHKLSPIGTKGLGESVMSALLLASYCKSGQKINLNIRGSGSFQQALIDAHPDGTVRGYVIERDTPLDLKENAGPWGSGLLSVLRTKLEEGEQPYIGTVPLLTGFLAKDLSYYWVQSEQIPSAVGLSVETAENQVTSALAFLVQVLPGAKSSEILHVEKHLNSSGLKEHVSPIQILSRIFQDTSFVVLEEKDLTFQCNCSLERVQRALLLVGSAELQSMLDENGSATVHCDFCSKDYEIDRPTLEGLISKSTK